MDETGASGIKVGAASFTFGSATSGFERTKSMTLTSV
jgi:hypothetical protein